MIASVAGTGNSLASRATPLSQLFLCLEPSESYIKEFTANVR